jgi:hypothetical protein
MYLWRYSSRNWKFSKDFPNFHEYPWLGDEVLVSCNSCFENILKDFAIKKSKVSFESKIRSWIQKKKY